MAPILQIQKWCLDLSAQWHTDHGSQVGSVPGLQVLNLSLSPLQDIPLTQILSLRFFCGPREKR